jgi:hypothetical protein
VTVIAARVGGLRPVVYLDLRVHEIQNRLEVLVSESVVAAPHHLEVLV